MVDSDDGHDDDDDDDDDDGGAVALILSMTFKHTSVTTSSNEARFSI